MRVTVFGGSSPQPGSPAYQEAWQLGWLLGSASHTILTGGYYGTMEAVSRGAAEAGAHVIGITCDEVEAHRPGGVNAWVNEERRYPTLRSRLFALIDGCDAAIALPGGAGTLAEISLTWNQLILGSVPSRPLILIGSGWKKTFGEMFRQLNEYTSQSDRGLLQFVETPSLAVARTADYEKQKKS